MDNFKKALLSVITFTVFCGFIYTMVMTGICQVLFPNSANGKIIEVKGVKYREVPAGELLKRYLLIYGLGGIIVPFICIKIIDVILVGLGLV